DTERIAECSRSGGCRCLKQELRTERRRIYHPIIVHAALPRVEENTCAAAQAGLAIAQNIVGKANTWSEVVHAVTQAIVRKPIVTGEEESGRGIGEDRGVYAGDQVRQSELRPAVLDLALRPP